MYFCYFLSLELEEKVFPSPESTHVNSCQLMSKTLTQRVIHDQMRKTGFYIDHFKLFLHMFTRRAQYTRQQVANTTHFSPTHLSWAGFRPVRMGMANNEYCNTKGIFLPC